MRSPLKPTKTKAIPRAKVKTDKISALTLAKLLRGGFVAESYISPSNIMDLGRLIRYRASLVRIRTTLKTEIHTQLLMYGIRNEHYYKVNGYLNIPESLDRQIVDVSRRISHTSD